MEQQTPKRAATGDDRPFAEVEASLEKSGRVEDLIRLYESRTRQVPFAEAAQLWARAGELARERLRNAPRAEELYRKALLADSRSLEALRGLRALAEQKHDHGQLAEVLEKLALATKGAEGSALLMKAADLYEQKLNRRDRAILSCQLATRVQPADRAAYRRVRQLLLSDHRYQSAFDSLERERAALGDAGMSEEYVLFAERLIDDPTEHGLALKAVHLAAQLDPQHPRAEKVQKNLQKFEHTWRDRVRTIRQQSADERHPRTAAHLSLLVAKLFAWYDAGATSKVKEALDRCFLLWPAMPDALLLIERIAEKSGDLKPALQQFEKMAEQSKDRHAQVDLWLRAGTLRLTRMNDPTGALTCFLKAAASDPSRPDAASLAAELLLEDGKADEAIAVLDTHLSTLKERHAHGGLRVRLAELCRAALNDRASARAHLEAALKVDPLNAHAAYQLVKLLSEDEQLDALLPYLDLALFAPRPVGEKMTLCEGIALLLEEQGNPKGAFSVLARAFPLQPTRPLLLATLTEQGLKAGAEAELATALRRGAQLAPEPAAVEIWKALAHLLESPLARPEEARAAWSEVLKRAPNDAQAAQALKNAAVPPPPPPAAAMAKAAVPPPPPAAALRPAPAAAPAGEGVAGLEAEARRLELSAAEPTALLGVYRKILDLEPDNLTALKKLGGAAAQLGQWEDVANVAQKLAAFSDTPAERQEWRSRLAQLHAERLNRKEEAATGFLELLSQGAATAAVISGLERLVQQGVRRAEIARALAEHYGKAGDYQRQVASLLVQLSTAQSAAEQKDLLSLLADAQEKHLADSAAALESRLRGLALDPADATFRAEAIRLARDLSSHAELARFLVDLGARSPDTRLGIALMQEAAELAEEGGAIDEAANALKAALAKSPDDLELLGRLTQLYLGSKRAADADQVLRRQLLVAEGAAKAPLYIRLSEVSAELGRPREAAQALEEAIKAGADEGELIPRVCELLERAGRVGELSTALARWVAVAEKAGDKALASRLSLKRAQVLEASIGDKAEAVKNYAAILEKRPSDPDALAALELLLGDESCREEAARALIPAYESVKEHRKLVAALGVLSKSVQDNLEKVLALKQAAYVQLNHLRQPEQAFAALAEALQLQPGDASIRNAARQAAEDADALDLFAEVLTELLEQDFAPSIKVPLHRDLADVYEKKLDNRAGAIAELRSVLTLDPKNLDALKSLQRLHRASEEWSALAEVLERLAALATEPAEKISLWREAAVLHQQRLRDPESAAQAWRQVAERDPLDREAAANLDRLCTELDRPQELAFALELRRAQEGQSPQGRELAYRLALLRQARLSDAPGALQLFRQIVTEDPGHSGAREALEAWATGNGQESASALEILDPVLVQLGDHARRIALREARLDAALTDEKARLSAEIRAIYERDLAQPERAFIAALKAFNAGLDPEGTSADLERLAKETGSFEELAEIYEEASANAGEHAGGYLRRAAELREQLGQTEDAIRLWKQITAAAPQDRAALDSLGRLYERSQNAKNLSEVYTRKAQLTQNPAERLELLTKAGEAYEAAGDDTHAIAAFRNVLAIQKSVPALRALDRLYGKSHHTAEQADVLLQLAQLSDGDVSSGFLARRGQLLEKSGAAGEAAATYGQVLQIAPGDAVAVAGLERLLANEVARHEAARLLEPVYRSVSDNKKLVEVLDVRLATVAPNKRLELLTEIANLREALGHKALAFAARLRAFSENPEDEQSRDELERVAADSGSFDELAGAYEDQLDRGGSEALVLELSRRLAVLYGDRLARNDLAVKYWEQVFAGDPGNVQALEALARIHRSTRQLRELASVMKRQVGLEGSVAAQVHLLFELAQLAEESLSDKALAAESYQAILERNPEDPNAIKALSKVLADSERWAELATLLGQEIALAEAKNAKEEANDLRVRLGRLKLSRLGDHRGGLELYEEVLRRRAGHAGAVGALEEMARSDSPLRGEAATMLEPVFATGGDYLKLVSVYESRASTETVALERAGFLRKAAELYAGPIGQPDKAFLVATQALQQAPEDGRSLSLCLKLAEAADMREALAEILEELSERVVDDAARAVVFRTLAKLQEQLGEHEAATSSWKKVLQFNPSDAEALEAAGQLFAQQGNASELLAVLQRQLAVAEEPARRAALLTQIGTLQDDKLEDAAAALVTFRRVLELEPQSPAALERMDWLCQKQERWPELADILARRIAAGGNTGSLDLKFRLAQVRELKLLDKFGALDLYTQILAENPRHEGALASVEDVLEKEPAHQAAADVLHQAYRQSGDEAKLVAFLEGRVTFVVDHLARKELLLELATLREKQAQPELAYLALYRAFKEDPNDPEVRRRLEKNAEHAESFDELASAYEEELPRIAEPADVAEVCIKLGVLNMERLDDPERAVIYFERARTQTPEIAGRVLMPLERLYQSLAQHERRANVIADQIALEADPNEKIALLFKLGQVAQNELQSPDRAAQAYEQILQLDASQLASARLLEQLYETAGNQQKLYKILEHQRDRTQGAERERILGKMAQVSAEGLSDLGHSIDLYRELLAKNPKNEQAFHALDGLLDRAGRHDELKALLEGRLKGTVDPRELVRLNERIGRITYRNLKQPEAAIPYLKAALERDARHRGALETLLDLYQELGNKTEVVAVLRRLVPLQEAAEGVKAIRIKLAEALAELGRREEALDAARRALEVEPHDADDLDRVQKLFTSLRAYGDAVRALELRANVFVQAEDKDQAVATLFEVADLWMGAASRPESAGPVLERILELDPANRRAYELASDLFTQHNDWRSYAQLVDRYIPHLVTDEEKLAALQDLARVQEQKLGQKDLAFMAMCRALGISPQVDQMREEVERLADETGSYDELAAVYEQVADDLPRGPLAERLYLTLAKVHDQKLDDAGEAEASLRKILEFDPTNALALDALAAMFARRGATKEYVVALEQKLETAGSIEQRKQILREIARVFDEQKNDPVEAANALQRALDLEPDVETLRVLATLHRRQSAWSELVSALLRVRDLAASSEERGAIQVEVAQVYERDVQDVDGAIAAYRQAFELDPANREALESLERLYTKLDRPAELLEIFERQLNLTDDYREKTKVLFKSAAIWEDKYHNLQNADLCVDGVLQIEPSNLQAIVTLERLRREQGRWDELVAVIDRHLQLATVPQQQAELLVQMGEIYHQQLRLADRAVDCFTRAFQIDSTSRPALHALGMLYERSGNWPDALQMLSQEVALAGSSPDAVELHYRMGKISEDMLMDPGSARQSYEAALAIDPGYLPAIRALKTIHESAKDWTAYETALIQEAQQTEDPEAKSKACLEVAKFYAETKEDRDTATRWWEEAIRLQPDALEAARPLADVYTAREDWELGERMLDIVVAQMTVRLASDQDGAVAKELCRQLYRLGYVAQKLGKQPKALDAYERAYQLDATYLPALESYGNLLVEVGRLDEALKIYQSILIHHGATLTNIEKVDTYYRLGEIHLGLKQEDRAQNHYQKALAIDAGHEPSLRALVQLADAAGRHDKAAEFRQQLAEVLDGEQKFTVLTELGKLAREKLNDAHMAIEALVGAHKLNPDALEVMDALYVLYRQTRQGQKAADTLEKMLQSGELRAQPERAKRVHFALGEICRDELKELDRAVQAFNAALDLDHRFIEAFSSIEALLGGQKQWKQLEENYARMIQRIPKTDDTHAARMLLWRALGDLYLKVLKHAEGALMAYQVVSAGLPDDASAQETYAELAAAQPGNEDKAVAAYRKALLHTASPAKIVSALAELAAKQKDYDSAYLAAQVAHGFLGEAKEGEKEILAKLGPYAKKREQAQKALTDRLWQAHLFHPKIRGPLGELMAILFEQAGHLYAVPHAQYQVNPRKHRIDVASAQEFQLHHYRYVAKLLGTEGFELYSPFLTVTRERLAKKSSEPAPEPLVNAELLQTHPISLKVGGKFFGETGQKEIQYVLGRAMALMRPELALSQRLAPERLEQVLQAAISLSVSQFRFTADPRAIEAERKVLDKALPEPAKAALARVVREYLKVARPGDIQAYLEGCELTAVRTGLFVAGEMEPVKRMLMGESGAAHRVPARAKLRELMVFALSEDLHALRVAVGTNVEVSVRR